MKISDSKTKKAHADLSPQKNPLVSLTESPNRLLDNHNLCKANHTPLSAKTT